MSIPRVDGLSTDTPGIGVSHPWWGREEQPESVNVPLMTGTGVSYNSGIPASEGNPVSSVQTGGNRNMSSTLAG